VIRKLCPARAGASPARPLAEDGDPDAAVFRRALDLLYDLAGWLAAVFMVAILVIIVAQIGARLLSIKFPGGTDYAGYCMAAASFLALAHTFRRGAHIRVELLLQHLAEPARRRVELAVLAVGSALSWYFAWYAIRGVRFSWMLGDVSQGQDATPLWIPQSAMAVGVVLLAIAMTDQLLRVLRGADPRRGDGPAREA
jgi:TRAP-type C4-dicarboxylate transport system permease small subunit